MQKQLCVLLLLCSLCFALKPLPFDVESLTTALKSLNEEQLTQVLQQMLNVDRLTCDEIFCNDPDCGKNVTELITSKGYPCEDHYALTPDGYWLSLQRITHGKNNTAAAGKPIVFLQHGLEDASHTWVINNEVESLGFILADAGYEVWLGNNRGNTYSNTNENYSYNDKNFWTFSWDEMANIDLPTQINYVLGYTGQKELFYVGHSEGTTQAFAGFQNTTLASKIKLFVALAPVATVGHCTSDFIQTLAFLNVDTFLEAIGWPRFLVQHCWLDNLLDAICDVDNGEICQISMCVLAGCNPSNINATRYDVYMQLDPAGTSVQNMNHWGQMVREDTFCYYRYLTRHENEQKYGSADPPCYDLSQMAAPVAIFSGGKDKLADPTDVAYLLSQLNPSLVKYSTEIDYYEHMDFVWGMDAYQVLYPQILSLFEQYK